MRRKSRKINKEKNKKAKIYNMYKIKRILARS